MIIPNQASPKAVRYGPPRNELLPVLQNPIAVSAVKGVRLFGYDLSTRLSPTRQFAVCCLLVFCFYLPYGFIQESIFRTPGFQYGVYITLLQQIMYVIMSLLESRALKQPLVVRAKVAEYVVVAVCSVVASSLSNQAGVYMNYPTKVLMKSSKIIPVMMMGRLILGRHYAALQYVGTGMLLLGISLFSVADAAVSPVFQPKGLAYMSVSLLFESVGQNYLERIMVRSGCTEREMLFFNSLLGVALIIAGLSAPGTLRPAVDFCAENWPIYLRMIALSLFGYGGSNVMLALTRNYGVFVSLSVSMVRKVVTVVLSFVLFPKPFAVAYVFAGIFAFSGIGVNIYENLRQRRDFVTNQKARIHWL